VAPGLLPACWMNLSLPSATCCGRAGRHSGRGRRTGGWEDRRWAGGLEQARTVCCWLHSLTPRTCAVCHICVAHHPPTAHALTAARTNAPPFLLASAHAVTIRYGALRHCTCPLPSLANNILCHVTMGSLRLLWTEPHSWTARTLLPMYSILTFRSCLSCHTMLQIPAALHRLPLYIFHATFFSSITTHCGIPSSHTSPTPHHPHLPRAPTLQLARSSPRLPHSASAHHIPAVWLYCATHMPALFGYAVATSLPAMDCLFPQHTWGNIRWMALVRLPRSPLHFVYYAIPLTTMNRWRQPFVRPPALVWTFHCDFKRGRNFTTTRCHTPPHPHPTPPFPHTLPTAHFK